jgi:hypothetical protein
MPHGGGNKAYYFVTGGAWVAVQARSGARGAQLGVFSLLAMRMPDVHSVGGNTLAASSVVNVGDRGWLIGATLYCALSGLPGARATPAGAGERSHANGWTSCRTGNRTASAA